MNEFTYVTKNSTIEGDESSPTILNKSEKAAIKQDSYMCGFKNG